MEWLKKIVDNALADMAEEKVLMTTPRNVPAEMLDKSMSTTTEDWKGWKPIDSIITDDDINKFEINIGIGLPLSYREFLKYKHFYVLRIPDKAVNLPGHLPDNTLPALRDFVFNHNEPELLIGRRYINFADFHDYGHLCFDANVSARDNEYKVVYINYENLDDIHFYAHNFRELLEADCERGNDFIDRLNEYYNK